VDTGVKEHREKNSAVGPLQLDLLRWGPRTSERGKVLRRRHRPGTMNVYLARKVSVLFQLEGFIHGRIVGLQPGGDLYKVGTGKARNQWRGLCGGR